jgi:spore coat protein U-like protein
MLLGATLAHGAQCTVATNSVAFGAYDTFAVSAADSTGSVAVTCDVAASYSLAIGAGGSGTFSREMASGGNRLAYGLFTDATRSVVWGDGTGATARVNGSGLGATHIVYGRVPARQNVRVGSYADALVVTVDF